MEQDGPPKIQLSEIKEWEKRFIQNVSSAVKFDTTGDGNTSFKFYMGSSGTEIEWSGIINLGSDEYIKWKFSLTNDVLIDASFKLKDETKDLVKKIFDLYTVWHASWADSLAKSNTMIKEHRNKESIIRFSKERMTILAGLR